MHSFSKHFCFSKHPRAPSGSVKRALLVGGRNVLACALFITPSSNALVEPLLVHVLELWSRVKCRGHQQRPPLPPLGLEHAKQSKVRLTNALNMGSCSREKGAELLLSIHALVRKKHSFRKWVLSPCTVHLKSKCFFYYFLIVL